MSTVLYEAPTGYGTIVPALIIPFIVFLGLILVGRSYDPVKTFKGKNSSTVIKVPNYKLLSVGILFVIVCTAFILQNFLKMYRAVIVPYANGQYEIVEGYVQNFIPGSPGDKSDEMFDIDDVHFEYAEARIALGYHKTKPNGGVIRGDWQYLKVGYVYFNENYGNIIVYIEEITPY